MSWDRQHSILDHPRKWAAYLPDAPALTFGGRTRTWAALHQRVEAFAGLLESRGIRHGDRVAVLARNHEAFFELLYACLRTGVILAPLNWRLAPRELDDLLLLAEPALLLHDDVGGGDGRPLAEALTWAGPRLRLDALPHPAFPATAARDRLATGFEDPALLLFTSGTTGRPKAAVLPGRQLFWNAINSGLAWRLTRDDSTIVYTPLFHTGAINVLAFPLLHCGGHVVLHEAFDAATVLRDTAFHRVTTIFGVPTTLQMLLEHPLSAAVDLSSLRLLLCGGAPLPVSLIHAWAARGIPVTQGFGMTEVGPNCFFLPPHEALPRAGSVGRPMPACAARIMTADGREAAPGEVGELWLSGPHVCKGYFRNPSATAVSLDAEGWFHTGDLARTDADGFFYVAGRKKDMFISGGENVYPAEVEVALAAHPEVAECAVVGMPDTKWGEVGCAFFVPRTAEVHPEDLRRFLRATLAAYKVPKAFVALPALPRNPSGKVVKDRLVQEAQAHAR